MPEPAYDHFTAYLFTGPDAAAASRQIHALDPGDRAQLVVHHGRRVPGLARVTRPGLSEDGR